MKTWLNKIWITAHKGQLLQDEMNYLGEQGWEFVSQYAVENQLVMFFKREVPPIDEPTIENKEATPEQPNADEIAQMVRDIPLTNYKPTQYERNSSKIPKKKGSGIRPL